MGPPPLELSLVIPVFQGAGFVATTVERLRVWLEATRLPHEIVVVDDGSTDGTPVLLEALAARHPAVRLLRHPRNLGKGAAVRAGLLAARGRFRIFTDADLAYPVENLAPFLAALRGGVPIVVANRENPASRCEMESGARSGRAGRHALSGVFRAITWCLGLSDLGDTQAGLKGFSADAAQRLFAVQHVPGFAFDVEVLHQARLAGLPVRRLPVVYHHQRGRGPGRVVGDSLGMLRDLLAVRWHSTLGHYDAVRRAPGVAA